MLSEADLVKQLKKRNVNAFAQLYTKYAPALYGIVLQLTPGTATASEILEESFIKFYADIESFDATKGGLFGWMVQITLRQCKEVLRMPPGTMLQKLKPKLLRPI